MCCVGGPTAATGPTGAAQPFANRPAQSVRARRALNLVATDADPEAAQPFPLRRRSATKPWAPGRPSRSRQPAVGGICGPPVITDGLRSPGCASPRPVPRRVPVSGGSPLLSRCRPGGPGIRRLVTPLVIASDQRFAGGLQSVSRDVGTCGSATGMARRRVMAFTIFISLAECLHSALAPMVGGRRGSQ